MSSVTGLARLVGRILSSVHMGNFSPVSELRFQPGYCSYEKFQPGYRAEISAITEINKARTFKFHPGNRAGVFIWENFQLGYRELGNRASPPSHMNTSKFLQRKER